MFCQTFFNPANILQWGNEIKVGRIVFVLGYTNQCGEEATSLLSSKEHWRNIVFTKSNGSLQLKSWTGSLCDKFFEIPVRVIDAFARALPSAELPSLYLSPFILKREQDPQEEHARLANRSAAFSGRFKNWCKILWGPLVCYPFV